MHGFVRPRGVIAAALVAVVVWLASVAVATATTPEGAGTEHRDWVAGPADPPSSESPAAYQVAETDDLMMKVRDGTELAYNLYLPKGAPVGPCLLNREGYGKSAGNTQAEDFASRGYAVVDADNRGEGSSQGYWHPFSDEQNQDGYDLIEWMARQPWCNGKVGTFGTSYMGIVQLLSAKLLPPHLKAMIPVQAWGDAYNGYYYPGGWEKIADGAIWGLGAAQEPQLLPPSTDDPNTYLEHLANQPSGVRYEEEVWAHPNFDGFWRIASSLAPDHAALAKAHVPIMFQTGWDDLMTYPELKAYRQFAAAGGTRMVVIGPWTHGAEDGVQPWDFQTMRVLWFDRWLKGIQNGIDKKPRALIYVPGPNKWRWESDWPIPDARHVSYYFDGTKSGSSQSQNDGTLTTKAPSGTQTPDSYTYSPTLPDTAGPGTLFANEQGQEAGSEAIDQRPFEPLRLSYTTAPLRAPTEVTGPATVAFWVSSTAGDPDFVARLVDVAPDGTAIQLARGWVSVAHYPDETNPKPLGANEVREVKISIWPTSNVFDTGHRIRLDIGGSDEPLMVLNQTPATDTIYHDAEHRSHVELPLIGTGG